MAKTAKTHTATLASNAPKAVTITVMQTIKTDAVIASVLSRAKTYNLSGCALVASMALCYIEGHYQDEKNRRKKTETRDLLKKQLNEGGVKENKIYRFIGIAESYVSYMVKRHGEFGGALGQVLRAKNPQDAEKIISADIDKETKGKNTLTALGDVVDAYRTAQRSPKPSAAGEPVPVVVKPTTSKTETVQARIMSDPSVLSEMKPEVITKAMENANVDYTFIVLRALTVLAEKRDMDSLGEIQEALEKAIEHAGRPEDAVESPDTAPGDVTETQEAAVG